MVVLIFVIPASRELRIYFLSFFGIFVQTIFILDPLINFLIKIEVMTRYKATISMMVFGFQRQPHVRSGRKLKNLD